MEESKSTEPKPEPKKESKKKGFFKAIGNGLLEFVGAILYQGPK